MFNKLDTSKKDEFLGKAKALRELRSTEKQKDDAAIKIQALVRRFLTRCRLLHQMHEEVDKFLQIPADRNTEYKPQMKPSIDVFKLTQKFLIFFKEKEDRTRFECLCKYILLSMNAESMKHVYVSVMLSKNHTLLWIQQLKAVLWKCCLYFKSLKPEIGEDMKTITVCLSMLVTFTSCTNWKVLKGKMGDSLKVGMMQLCNNVMGDLNSKGLYRMLQTLLVNGLARSKPSFKAATLAAIVTMSLRPLMASNFSDKLMTMFILHILSVPGLIHHLSIMSHESVVLMMTHRVFSKVIELLYQDQSARIIFNVLEGNYALCLLANLIHLGGSEMEGLVENTNNFMMVMTKLLESCKIYVMNKKSNLTHWHPVLGWFSQKGDQNLHDAMPYVVLQLQQLWSLKMIRLLFEQLFVYNDMLSVYDMQKCSSQPSPSKNIFKKAIEKASQKSSNAKVKLDSPVLQSTCLACKMYLIAMNTLTQLKLDIVAGLCFQDVVLPRLWKLITDLGSHSGLKAFMDILTAQPNSTEHMVFSLLQLGCETATHSITILDDMELYEQGKPFSLDNLVAISYFLNQFYFKVIWNGLMDVKAAGKDPTMGAVLGLLTVLYERDCRRAYAPDDHWLTRDVKPSVLIAELERGKKQAQFLLQKVPHIIPHKERVILFRKMVAKEKDVLGLTESACVSPQSTLISVHRGRIVEDGYRQLAALPVNALKGVIRVKFVNEQGLDEAGIDQDGVFKEFLEETIKHVFDPSLNLFRVTDEQKLYPSPTSYMQDSHLSLFEFVGRMLGKAVYEGIVVEVPFASFFLSQMLSQQHNKTYSSLDELPSLDPDLYKSLTYVKHYEGDVSDLDLTFSYDEDVMGKIVNHELRPGGKAIPVTNDNKISYIHLMAHFKMRVQIKEQTKAFIHGFKSVVNHEWLSMFSPPELQKLISGDTADLDMEDLRRHTQYYGGFHGNHRVVCWLWDILEKDFTPAERGLFLKFVTSCSKPPLLGFAHLEPPFSIRCVEVSDEQDTGDTVGSVLKGFFNIRKRDPVGRLPTSSTCFNLLKLPNYQKKSTLREKLRYAITSHTGFELS